MTIFDYRFKDTVIHRLSGLSKLICFLILTAAVMYSYDIRFFAVVLVFSFVVLKLAKIRIRELKFIFMYVGVFLLINQVLSFIFAPEYGTQIYESYTLWFRIHGNYNVTYQQAFYQLSKLFKYSSVIPLGIIFLYTTDPGEFASSLNAIFVPYKVAYAVSLTLRYFPDIQRVYHDISKAQQARGLDISRKTSFWHRFKYAVATMMPLIFSSLDRIDVITNAMQLRGFAKHRTRTWYGRRKAQKGDFIALAICFGMAAAASYVAIFVNHGRFYNPFIVLQ